jgi:hypothetical protein
VDVSDHGVAGERDQQDLREGLQLCDPGSGVFHVRFAARLGGAHERQARSRIGCSSAAVRAVRLKG